MRGLAITPPAPASRMPLRIDGALRVPSDKSITQRGLLFGLLARGTTTLIRPLDAGDTRSVLRAIARLGARIETAADGWRITGAAPLELDQDRPLDLENSGTGTRLLLGLLAGQGVSATLTGDASLRQRPMGRVVRPLSAMGARFEGAASDRLPLRVSSTPPLAPYVGTLEVASAQVKSAVLLAALGAAGETRLREPAPTRAHTEAMLPAFGVALARCDGEIRLTGPQTLRATSVAVPADPSSGAFHAAAAALLPGSRVVLTELLLDPRRTAFYSLLARMGARVTFEEEERRCGEPVGRVTVANDRLTGIDVAPSEVPDLVDEVPLVALLGALATGRTTVRGAAELRVKESDRLAAIGSALVKMGARLELFADGFAVEGGHPLRGARVESHADHRIAMALAIAALCAQGTTTIDDFDCAAVSYPAFLDHLAALLHARPFTPVV